MNTRIRIDFVSDVSCPWCAVGLRSLEAALARLGEQVTAEMHFQPFELNPKMPAEGRDISEYLIEKYGLTPEQYKQNTEAMRARGEEVGFAFSMDKRRRVYNTFDAHRLLHWAGLEGHQLALKHALFKAYFTDGEDPSSHEVLAGLAENSGLNATRSREILSSDEYALEVRERERYYLDLGINAVPSVIINERQLIRGAQPVEVFAQVLRNSAAAQ
ncbi:MAG: DsbA family oxidoreductase [Pseudomonadota bacterium]